jgi:zinc and cadmium transporter
MILTYIIFFSILGSLGAIILASILLLFPSKIWKVILPGFISYATGTLLGAAFLGLIPHALDTLPSTTVFMTVLVGLILFFLLEKIVLWRHCHNTDCHVHEASGPLILIGDAFHNFIDGIVIAAAFITSVPLGMATAFSVITHEIPQEVGDFAILLKNNYSKQKAFGLNIISGISAVFGGVLAYFFLEWASVATPYIMGIASASFIYIAIGDLIPHLHEKNKIKDSIIQTVLIIAGIMTMYFIQHQH